MRWASPGRSKGCSHMDTLGIEPRAFRMRSGCDTTTPCARVPLAICKHGALAGRGRFAIFWQVARSYKWEHSLGRPPRFCCSFLLALRPSFRPSFLLSFLPYFLRPSCPSGPSSLPFLLPPSAFLVPSSFHPACPVLRSYLSSFISSCRFAFR